MHPAVSRHLSSRFRAWHARWAEHHVSARQQQVCSDWLMGRLDDIKPSRTTVLRNNDLRRPPYLPYSRYRVEWLEAAAPAPAGAAQAASPAGDAEK